MPSLTHIFWAGVSNQLAHDAFLHRPMEIYWEAKKLSNGGLKWRVNNGRSTNRWKDRWFLNSSFLVIQRLEDGFNEDYKLEMLINRDEGYWNKEVPKIC